MWSSRVVNNVHNKNSLAVPQCYGCLQGHLFGGRIWAQTTKLKSIKFKSN